MYYKHILFCIVFSGLWLISTAQMKFIEGYIVTNDHKKTDCLIRNIGNAESSSSFEYKFKEDNKIEKIELSKIEAFGVENESKFVRALIKIDVSPNRINHLKDTINSPEWQEGHAYLRILVEGENASLYSYYDEGNTLFYYRVGNSEIGPLIHKVTNLEITPGIIEQSLSNNAYIEQLRQNLPYGDNDQVSKVSYTKKDLVKYFVNYHLYKKTDYKVTKSASMNKVGFKFKIGTSYNTMSMDGQDYADASKIIFSKKSSVGVGAEVEVLLPFNNYKWSIFAESNYYSYKSVYSDNVFNSSHDGYIVDYKTIEVPIGITYYMNINSNNRLFVRGAFVPHLILDSSYIAFNAPKHYDFAPSARGFIGVGYNFHRLAMEFRYYTSQDITQNLYKRGSNYSQISFRVSFVLFKNKMAKIK